jgi:3-hydroxymyristoyl/3-hydroxydecanoyl-(acyl carrier protein) dehydratase
MNTLLHPSVQTSAMQQMVGIAEPYYSLRNIRPAQDFLKADILLEDCISTENSLVCSAAAIRHLSVLGSCALAMKNNLSGKKYYLPTFVHLDRARNNTHFTKRETCPSTALSAQAKVVYLEDKTGKVETAIYTKAGACIFNIDISYHIFNADLFEALFRKNRREDVNVFFEYLDPTHITLYNMRYEQNILSGDLGTIDPAICAGYFEHYPSLPASAICDAMTKLGAKHLQKIMGKKGTSHHSVNNLRFTSPRPIFSGEQVLLQSTFLRKHKGGYTFFIMASNEQDTDLGDAEITFELSY